MQRPGAEVAEHKGHDLVDEIFLVRQPFEEASRRGLPFLIVAARRDPSIVRGGRGRFAKVMTEDAEACNQVVLLVAGAFQGEPVQTMERVDPDIAFRVPDWVLRAALQRREFRIESKPPAVAQELKTQGWFDSLEQEFFPFSPEPFARLPVLRHGLTESHCLRRGGQSKPCGQLHTAQDAKRVFGETIRYVAEYVRIEIGPTVEGVVELQCVRIPGHRIHGEIAPGQRFVDVHVRVGLSQRARGGLVVGEQAGGNGNIDGQALQLEDAKGLADELHGEMFREQRMELTRRQPGNFDVQIVRLPAQYEVAYTTADQPHPTAGMANELFNVPQRSSERRILDTKADRHL